MGEGCKSFREVWNRHHRTVQTSWKQYCAEHFEGMKIWFRYTSGQGRFYARKRVRERDERVAQRANLELQFFRRAAKKLIYFINWLWHSSRFNFITRVIVSVHSPLVIWLLIQIVKSLSMLPHVVVCGRVLSCGWRYLEPTWRFFPYYKTYLPEFEKMFSFLEITAS